MINKLLIANRGEIAARIIRTAQRMGIATVAVYSDADASAPHATQADEAIHIGPAAASESYLHIPTIIEAAKRTGCQAVHPGYGFLSENAGFAEACLEAGLLFVGPSPNSIRLMGSKAEARKLMMSHGVPVVPGYEGEAQDVATLSAEADRIGYPILVKASAGGGGKGMRIVRAQEDLAAAVETAQREAMQAFGDSRILLERYVDSPRHIEFQIFGDTLGDVIHLHERECSVQRRHQKIIEEAPAPNLAEDTREAMAKAAIAAGKALGYHSAGTVEFIVSPTQEFFFLEVNTRLQVEHPVTEAITGLDLVEWQLRVAEGAPLPLRQEQVKTVGSAIECRVYAEDPQNGFLPVTGTIEAWVTPESQSVRVDSGVVSGHEVGIHYDPMLAKIIVWGETRAEACRHMAHALRRTSCLGLTTNLDLLRRTIDHPRWRDASVDTHFVADHIGELTPPLGATDRVVTLCAAAASIITDQQAAPFPSLPALSPGWRNNRWRDPELALLLQGEEESARVAYRDEDGPLTLTIEDQPLHVMTSDHGGIETRLTLNGHRVRLRVCRSGSSVFVDTGAHHSALELQPRLPQPADTSNQGAHTAPMPGKIVSVAVSVGDVIEEGAIMVVMEAMKMEHSIQSHVAGRVTEIVVEEGDQVARDAELVCIEPLNTDA